MSERFQAAKDAAMAACMRKAGDGAITPMAVKIALSAFVSELEKTHRIMSQADLDRYTARAESEAAQMAMLDMEERR